VAPPRRCNAEDEPYSVCNLIVSESLRNELRFIEQSSDVPRQYNYVHTHEHSFSLLVGIVFGTFVVRMKITMALSEAVLDPLIETWRRLAGHDQEPFLFYPA